MSSEEKQNASPTQHASPCENLPTAVDGTEHLTQQTNPESPQASELNGEKGAAANDIAVLASDAPGAALSPKNEDEDKNPNITAAISEAKEVEQAPPPYSTLSGPMKIFVVILASFASIISPISASIYYPSLNTLARDLNVSATSINLTITTYLIFQGIAPSFIGNFSDIRGRRPAYMICFSIYIVANIGLALQNNYAALLILRCVQSSGSSGTIAIGSAAGADVATRAERGRYMSYASMGVTLGPALGPLVGGLLDQFLGWRAIFWFLAIFASVFFLIVMVIMPETCRAVVGNGSVPPPTWQMSLVQYIRHGSSPAPEPEVNRSTIERGRKRPNPFASLKMVMQKETGTVLFFGSLLYSGYIAVLSTLSSQLETRYGFNSLKIGLCYIAMGAGSLTSRWTVGRLLDVSFRRQARIHNIPIVKNRQQDISKFPIEKARLQIMIPLVYVGCGAVVAYGWVMQYKTNLAGPLVMLFVSGHLISGAFSSMNTLMVDINKEAPATAIAANNLVRCLMAAAATAAANPLIERIGIGWTGTVIGGIWLVFSPLLFWVQKNGMKWRAEDMKKNEEKEQQVTSKRSAV